MTNRFEKCYKNAQRHKDLEGRGEVEVEQIRRFTTPKGREVELLARMDFVSTSLQDTQFLKKDETPPRYLIDWKTGSEINTDEYLLQMQVYIFVTLFNRRAILVSLLNNKKLVISPDISQTDYIPSICDDWIDIVESGEFASNEKYKYCDTCPYNRLCKTDLYFDLDAQPSKYSQEEKK
jgi:CRISPR/Cas system-associated exonuclease Cas4 (RecB family)